MVHLQFGENNNKLVHFREQKKIDLKNCSNVKEQLLFSFLLCFKNLRRLLLIKIKQNAPAY